MSQNKILSTRIRELLTSVRQNRLLVQTITDINEDQSRNEVLVALWSGLRQHGLGWLGTHEAHFAIGAYRVHQCALELLKRLFPLDTMEYPDTLAIVNVAQIAEADGGRRKDRVWLALTKEGRLALGYAASDSPILDLILPGLSGLWEFDTPREWDEGRHFRTRDVLTKLAAGLLAQDQDCVVLPRLKPVALDNARNHFEIATYDPALAWWPDTIGWKPYNIKTGYSTRHPFVQSLKPGEEVDIRFGQHSTPRRAVYAHSLQQSGKQGGLVFTHASSGYRLPGEDPVHFLDVMFYGGNAYFEFECPTEHDELLVTKVPAHATRRPATATA